MRRHAGNVLAAIMLAASLSAAASTGFTLDVEDLLAKVDPPLVSAQPEIARFRQHSPTDEQGGHAMDRKQMISFPLSASEVATGLVEYTERHAGRVIYVAGQLSAPERGRFFFRKQLMPGKAGAYIGMVELPASGRLLSVDGKAVGEPVNLVERRFEDVVCVDYPLHPDPAGAPGAMEQGSANSSNSAEPPPAVDNDGIVRLESLPGATAVVYLNFRGGSTVAWGGVAYRKPDVDNSQIRDVWSRVAEDFMPFSINVTTDRQTFEQARQGCRQQVIITPTDQLLPGSGGLAYLGSFNWEGDTPCWVFMSWGKVCADAISHEVGHTLGLQHMGRETNGTQEEYYRGHGSGETSWAPIMGVGYYRNVCQWSKGEYANANNHENELEIIATRNNNVGYRPDNAGATLARALELQISSSSAASAEGIIENTDDIDAFRFSTRGGAVSLEATPAGVSPNVALEAAIYDSDGKLVKKSEVTAGMSASVKAELPPGTYTFNVSGSGRFSPLTDGFSSYGSLGQYSVRGKVANAIMPGTSMHLSIRVRGKETILEWTGGVPPFSVEWGPAIDANRWTRVQTDVTSPVVVPTPDMVGFYRVVGN